MIVGINWFITKLLFIPTETRVYAWYELHEAKTVSLVQESGAAGGKDYSAGRCLSRLYSERGKASNFHGQTGASSGWRGGRRPTSPRIRIVSRGPSPKRPDRSCARGIPFAKTCCCDRGRSIGHAGAVTGWQSRRKPAEGGCCAGAAAAAAPAIARPRPGRRRRRDDADPTNVPG